MAEAFGTQLTSERTLMIADDRSEINNDIKAAKGHNDVIQRSEDYGIERERWTRGE